MIRKAGKGVRRSRRRGDAIIEAAITLAFFVSLLFGIEEFSRALYAYHFVSHAARQATRWASVNGEECAADVDSDSPNGSCNGTAGMNNGPASDSDITTYVQNLAPAGITTGNISTSSCGTATGTECSESTLTACANNANADGCMVKVTVNYTFHFLVPLVGTSIPMSSTSEMIIAH